MALILLKCLHLLYVNGFDISHLLHFHCKWGPESTPHSLNTLSPVSCLISLQLAPWGLCSLKIAEVIPQNKRFAKAFSYFRSLSKNMSPCVKTCVVQVVQHPHQSLCATKSYGQRHPFRGLPKICAAVTQIQQRQITRFFSKPLEKHPCLKGFIKV